MYMIFFIFMILGLEINEGFSNGTIIGTVRDTLSGDPISYVRIGIEGKSVGAISGVDGTFSIDLGRTRSSEQLKFFALGYEPKVISIAEYADKDSPDIYLTRRKKLPSDTSSGVRSNGVRDKIGVTDQSKYTFGYSGDVLKPKGDERGILLQPQEPFLLKEIKIHLKYNTLDSVLLRFNLYKLRDSLPGVQVNQTEWYAKGYSGDKWISKKVSDENQLISQDHVLTMEIVDMWCRQKKENRLFFTLDVNDSTTQGFFRDSPFAEWGTGNGSPLSMHVIGDYVQH